MTDQPQVPDPWRSFRGVMAGTLVLEAIVVLLALPVVGAVGGGLTGTALGYLIGLAVLLLLLTGLQGRPWAIWVNLVVQLAPIAGFLLYPGIGFIGVLFAAVWALIAYFRAEVLRRQRRGASPASGRDPQPGQLGARPQRVGDPPACGGVPHPLAGDSRRTDQPGTLSAVTERTLLLIKPDGVERRLVGEIVSRIERKGLTFAALELRDVGDELARRHYAEHEGKPFFAPLLEFITSGPVVAAIVQGPRAVAAVRQLAGATDPVEQAAPGTIRGDFGLETQFNLVHGSDSAESAEREIALWFSGR
jgi:nucleoside-diphosphate kinase